MLRISLNYENYIFFRLNDAITITSVGGYERSVYLPACLSVRWRYTHCNSNYENDGNPIQTNFPLNIFKLS
ncbi:unnamed protein product [Ceratitis capitata]|uniref:(Mediterranean fruit fly) hypothetical protein n=1 Tax=Ceratitis capitata TaxID=7213 RepID=A0A811U4J0_CERCA|nr:unnamed protein product [Ceratitis capitata]